MLQDIYYKIPSRVKHLLVTVKSISQEKAKYGNIYNNFYRSLIDNQKDASTYAHNNLQEFLDYVKKNSPYYENLVDIYSALLLTKDIVVKNTNLIKIGRTYRTIPTGGTTGQPMHVPYSKEAYQKEYAFWWYHRSFAELERGDKVATIAGHKVIDVRQNKPPFWAYNYYDKQLIFSSYHLSKTNLKYYVKELKRFKPVLIHGYPSSIYLIAHYILDNQTKLDFAPKMIVASSETLLDFQRAVIEKAFCCKVYIWYGNTEQCGHITECEYGKLHIQPRHSFVRILDEKNMEVENGGKGRIVATNFLNKCFPLINYDTNDYLTVSKVQSCKCGRPGKIVEKIDGRIEDYIILPDGRLVGRLDHVFKHAKNVKLAQIEQNKVSQIIIHIQKTNNYTAKEEKDILNEARSRLDNEIEIVFDYDTSLQKEKNAKFRFIKQNLNINKITDSFNEV